MEGAIDQSTGNLVFACQIVGRHGFLCPVCQKNVLWYRGNQYMRPSFRHRPGEGDESCENFHPGQSFIGKSEQIAHYSLPSIHINLSDLSQRVMNWNLEIFIPSAPDPSGKVIIEQALQGRRLIPCVKLQGSYTPILVSPDIEMFHLKTEGITSSDYDQVLQRPIPGLDPTAFNVFLFSETSAAQLPTTLSLFSTQQYILVWNKRLQTAIPDEILKHSLKDKQNWRCAIVEFPAEISEGLERWAKKYLQRTIRQRAPNLILISPLEREIIDRNFFLIAQEEPILFGIFGDPGTKKPNTIAIVRPDARHAKSLQITGNFPFFFSISSLSTGFVKIYLPEFEQISLNIGIRPDLALPKPQPVFIVSTESSGKELTTPIHSSTTPNIVDALKKGLTFLKTLKLPHKLAARIKVKERGSFSWRHVAFPTLPENEDEYARHHAYEAWLVERLNELINNPQIEWEIDFRNFGRLTCRQFTNIVALSGAKHLPLKIRSRLEWLHSLAQSHVHDLNMVISPSALRIKTYFDEGALDDLSKSDRELARKIGYQTKWPLKIEPYLSAAENELNVYLQHSATRGRYAI